MVLHQFALPFLVFSLPVSTPSVCTAFSCVLTACQYSISLHCLFLCSHCLSVPKTVVRSERTVRTALSGSYFRRKLWLPKQLHMKGSKLSLSEISQPTNVRHCLCLVFPPPSWLRHCLCLAFPPPSWLRHRLCLVFPPPSRLRHCLCLAVLPGPLGESWRLGALAVLPPGGYKRKDHARSSWLRSRKFIANFGDCAGHLHLRPRD